MKGELAILLSLCDRESLGDRWLSGCRSPSKFAGQVRVSTR